MEYGSTDDRIRRLIEERRRIEDQIARYSSRDRERRRKRDARRNFLAGAVALKHAARNEEFAKTLFSLLDAELKGRDRSLFELDSDLRSAFAFAAADYRGDTDEA